MTPHECAAEDAKETVSRGYDRCADEYLSRRAKRPPPELETLAALLPPGASVLDIGCGAGAPVTVALSERFSVTGVDVSAEQIARARARMPHGTFLHGDVMALEFPEASFDAAVAFYSIFHLPRGEQSGLFVRVGRWLRPGGYLLATLSRFGEAGYTESGFFGVTMCWSHFGLDEYRPQIAAAGFDVLSVAMAGEGYVDDDGPNVTHPLVLARRRGG